MRAETHPPKVVVWLPTGKDARIVCDILEREAFACAACEDGDAMLANVREDGGPLIVGDEALGDVDHRRLIAALDAQPEWSDLPVILLRGKGLARDRVGTLAERPSVTVVNRPLAVRTFVGLVRAAWMNRQRQLMVRDLQAAEDALQQLNKTLESQVAERTRLAEVRASQLQSLALELIEAERRERKRIAQLLHDDLQQHLAAVKMKLDAMVPDIPGHREADVYLGQCVDMLNGAIAKTRNLSRDLNPLTLYHRGLRPCLDGFADQFKHDYGLQVAISCAGDARIESPVIADFVLHAIRELLFNVVKHSGSSAAQVALREKADAIEVQVTDDGHGGKVEEIYARRGTAPGFGLFSIDERVQALGGRMVIESIPGDGWATTLIVPRADADGDSAADPEEALAAASPPIGAGGPDREESPEDRQRAIRIVVVDDHAVMREGVASLLDEQKGMSVIGQAASGREAVALLGEMNADVVLMDVSMSDMDGMDATQRIVGQSPGIAVIGLSMHDDDATRQEMIAAGAAAFLSKSDSPARIIQTIRETVREQRTKQR